MFEEIYSWIVSLKNSDYTVGMTLIYALLVLIGLYLLYRWIRKVNIEISTPTMLSAMTYVLFGGLLHVVGDTGTIPNPWWILFETPMVYILTLVFGMIALFISYLLQKKKVVISYIPVFAGIGTAASVLTFAYLTWFGITNAGATFDFLIILIVVGIAAAATAALWAVLRYLCRWNYVSHPMYLALIGSHFLDSSATGYSIVFHPVAYHEIHVVAKWLIELTGTAYSMFLLKLVVLVPSIWVLEKFKKEEDMEMLWYLIIFTMIVVGLGPGIRNLLRMVLWI